MPGKKKKALHTVIFSANLDEYVARLIWGSFTWTRWTWPPLYMQRTVWKCKTHRFYSKNTVTKPAGSNCVLTVQEVVPIRGDYVLFKVGAQFFSGSRLSCCWSQILNLACSHFLLARRQEGTSQGSGVRQEECSWSWYYDVALIGRRPLHVRKRIVLVVTSAGFLSGKKKKTLTFFFFLLNNNNIGPVKGLKSRQKKSGLRKRRKKKRRQKGGKTTRTCSKTVSNQILAHAQEELMLRRLTLD